jgi:hypothetical protein
MKRKTTPMEFLRQAYPDVEDVYLSTFLEDASGDVTDALELLRLNMDDQDDQERMLIDDDENHMIFNDSYDYMNIDQKHGENMAANGASLKGAEIHQKADAKGTQYTEDSSSSQV